MESVPVRIHREKLVEDLFGAQSEEHPDSLLNSHEAHRNVGRWLMHLFANGFVGVPLEDLNLKVERTSDAASG